MTQDQVAAHQARVARRPSIEVRQKFTRPNIAKPYPDYANMLYRHIELAGLPVPTREFKFHETRKWRIDLCWLDRKLALEVDGAVHRIKKRFHGDLIKHQALFFAGYQLLRVSTAQVRSGEALRMVERALG